MKADHTSKTISDNGTASCGEIPIDAIENAADKQSCLAYEITIEGVVQGVGFRPAVWRLASRYGLDGEVRNTPNGVLIHIAGGKQALDHFRGQLETIAPPLSLIEKINCKVTSLNISSRGFKIVESQPIDPTSGRSNSVGNHHAQVTPDAVLCEDCRAETLSPFERRFRYPFTNCTACGPRFSIVNNIPYDRANTTMAPFETCSDCAAEYGNPEDRRFHAQPIACHICGPKAWLVRLSHGIVTFDMHSMLDDVDAVCTLLQKGEIVAIKGIGGFHLACDATNTETIRKLRQRKHRDAKPFALMARDIDIIRQYAAVGSQEASLLSAPEAPIVLLNRLDSEAHVGTPTKPLPDELAPGLDTLGFMLPYTPLHVLILRRMERPVVMTSANLAGAPQITSNEVASKKLSEIADYALFHNRDIANRVDDSVVRLVAGKPRLLRRARGYAPGVIPLPQGFREAPEVLAFGGELKATFCMIKSGGAILSQHQGDLENPETFDDYQRSLSLYQQLYDHNPVLLAADKHPEYLSTKLARERAFSERRPLAEIQHHHAHVAAAMAENLVSLDSPPVLGVALDGVGYGDDGTIWGGEFMLASYTGYQRLGTFKPVAMIGGAQAIREPWRNCYAHIIAEMGWDRFEMNFSELPLFSLLEGKPLETINQMLKSGLNVPLASSCGRLFDAVAAAIGLCSHQAAYEGEGAMLLEACIDPTALHASGEEAAYPFSIPKLGGTGLPYIEPLAMWQALLGDLIVKTPVPIMAARFHKGLAKVITEMIAQRASATQVGVEKITRVVLTGGCFQNAALLALVLEQLKDLQFEILTHSKVPANDGGLALGQAAIAAAKFINNKKS